MKFVTKSIPKIDSLALTTGKPVYTDDIADKNALVVKLLRSPYAHAIVEEVDTEKAEKSVPGIEIIITHKDCPKTKFTRAGQSYKETSPYDSLILEEKVRYVGDPVAIIAADTEEHALAAMKLIKVKYKVLPAIIDMEKALDSEIIIHEGDIFNHIDMGYDNKRNLVATGENVFGDMEAELKKSDAVVRERYKTVANSQSMMETFRAYSYLDFHGKLTVVASTQVPFHARRTLARALELEESKVRVIKPRIGGGFGAKQTNQAEFYPALVTLKTGKPAKYIYTRKETLYASNSRHQMQMDVTVGAEKNGHINGIGIYTLSRTGAYGEHGAVTVGLSGAKTLPIYNKADASSFKWDVVYTNTMPGGAFRGFGATQGCFAVESAINQLADELNIDPAELRIKNLAEKGDVLHQYYGEVLQSTGMKRCIERGKELIGWDKKYPSYKISDTKVGALGMAITMQGSGISGIDTASVEIKLDDLGNYTLMVGSTDMGTGSDTILAQMAAEILNCTMEDIIVHGVDTDVSPFDPGSYASATTYVTGGAVVKAAKEMVEKIKIAGAELLEEELENIDFDGELITSKNGKSIGRKDLAKELALGTKARLHAMASNGQNISPPPMMAGFVEIEVDLETGEVKPIHFVGVLDIGQCINKNLATIQVEGGIVQGIGMALYEDVHYDERGKIIEDSFFQYKIPTRLDACKMTVEFENDQEPSGPFGAKSVGEVVINSSSPAIAHAVHNATGVWVRELPITAEKIIMGMKEKNV